MLRPHCGRVPRHCLALVALAMHWQWVDALISAEDVASLEELAGDGEDIDAGLPDLMMNLFERF